MLNFNFQSIPQTVINIDRCFNTPDMFSKGNMGPDKLHIKNYINDGFQHIADVKQKEYGHYSNWELSNVNEELLFSEHNSWVYVIVEDEQVVKLGETGQPLGVKGTRTFMLQGTQSRFGRLISHGDALADARDTDSRIRFHLWESAMQGKVSLYAFKCPSETITTNVFGVEHTFVAHTHKTVEKAYLTSLSASGCLPKLNKARI